MASPTEIVAACAHEFADQSVSERLSGLRDRIDGPIVFTTSFGLEDQVITHFIAKAGLAIGLVTLDTGRMFPETYDVWAQTEQRYGLRVQPYFPQAVQLTALLADQGVNGFYDTIDKRHACCGVRKVEPLNRALSGASAWITGLRGDASQTRGTMQAVEYDDARGLTKLSPIFDWSRERVDAFAASENIPVNALHAQGFPTIGCAPCTRAIKPGEDERAGRWWWEQNQSQECGLHVDESGQLQRANPRQDTPVSEPR